MLRPIKSPIGVCFVIGWNGRGNDCISASVLIIFLQKFHNVVHNFLKVYVGIISL